MRDIDKKLISDVIEILQAAITEPMVVEDISSAMKVKDDNITTALEILALVGGDEDRILDYYGCTFATPITDEEYEKELVRLRPALEIMLAEIEECRSRIKS